MLGFQDINSKKPLSVGVAVLESQQKGGQ